METKWCNYCKTEHPTDYFLKTKRTKSGISSICKKLKAARNIKEESNINTFLRKRIYQRMYRHLTYTSKVDPKLSIKYLGCSMNDLKKHLESQFKYNMSWSNYGELWSIDHKLPIRAFDLTNDKHLRELLNYKNIQPILRAEHYIKTVWESKKYTKKDKQ